MAETDSTGCRCSNISIMQLFHELKQRFPKVPDQIVSKVIQENFHDKTACETLLQRESNLYVQCYPGALISGDSRHGPQSPISDHCSAGGAERGAHLPRSQLLPRRTSDTGCRGTAQPSPLQQSSADGVAATALPTSEKQTDSDVSAASLPLSAAHACSARTPPYDLSRSVPSSTHGTPDEDDSSSSEYSPDVSIPDPGSTATPRNDPPCSSRGSAGDASIMRGRPQPRTLDEKLELSRIPLGQLVREVRERLTDRAGSEQKKGCDLTNGGNDSPELGDCEPRLVAPLTPPPVAPVGLPRDKSPRRLSATSDASSSQTSSTPISSKEGTPIRIADREPPPNETSPPRVSPRKSKSPPDHVTPKRPTTLSCDVSRVQPTPVSPREQPPISSPRNNSIQQKPRKSKDTSPVFLSPSINKVSSPNRLAPPTPNSPYLASSYPSRPSVPSSDKSPSRHQHLLNDLSPHSQGPGPTFPRNVPTESPKEYEVAVECVVCPSKPGDQQRSFTSVNLTLRPPSAETTLPIDISSGQSLTYTSASFDTRQGYQSHLQIRIGPALLQQQRERKDFLAEKLWLKKESLRSMQVQVQTMKLALARASTRPHILSKLQADISRLRGECERLTAAVDLYSDQNNSNNLPLGETDEDFYRNIYTGQRQQRAGWSCRVCTFRNHPLLSVCEECEMPRLSLGTTNCTADSDHPSVPRGLSNPVFSNNNNSSCAAGETSTSVSRTITPLQER